MSGGIVPPEPTIPVSGGLAKTGVDVDLYNRRLKQQIEEDELILIIINAIKWN